MYLGVDGGQTGTRGILVDREGRVLATAQAGGLLDAVAPGGVERMRDVLPGYRGETIIPGAGHWTQQERPDEFNAALLAFLRGL